MNVEVRLLARRLTTPGYRGSETFYSGSAAAGCGSCAEKRSSPRFSVKLFRLLLCTALTAAVAAPVVAHAESEWLNDFKKAQQEAKATHKLLLLDFTGSDWCGYCKRFDRDVLSQPKFKDYARNNLVLVELDFPRFKPLSPEVRKQNIELAQQYEVVGFPTIVVLNSNGEKLWRYDGYFPGGAGAFVEQLEKLPKG